MAPMLARPLPILAISSFLLIGCAKDRAAAPVEAPSPPADERPQLDEETYVSGADEVEDEDEAGPDGMDAVVQADADQAPVEGDFAVRTPERALEVAEAAVAAELDPKLTWKTSPLLPITWPSKEARVRYFFYPLSAHPSDMSQFHLFTPAYEVEVNLVDGSSEVRPIAKRRRLGVIEDRRASLLEREELELAENTLIRIVLAGQASLGDNNLWGYLKFFHENPELGQDIKRRAPAFARWVEGKKRH